MENLKFTKEQVKKSARFINYQDVLEAILDDGKTYALDDVEKQLNEFLNKEVS